MEPIGTYDTLANGGIAMSLCTYRARQFREAVLDSKSVVQDEDAVLAILQAKGEEMKLEEINRSLVKSLNIEYEDALRISSATLHNLVKQKKVDRVSHGHYVIRKEYAHV